MASLNKVDTPREPAAVETTTSIGTKKTSAIPTQKAAKATGVSDLDRQIESLRRCEYLKESEVKAICAKAREILVDESNVQRVDAPVTVSFTKNRTILNIHFSPFACGCY
tara:strand:+ start:140 stop:469 length:330 start_codon:yes stop_codon:yes gene_type:complete